MEPKLISYITVKYTSKSDMMYETGIWAEIIEPMLPRFKEAGALREVVSQVWNKEGSFILANIWEYADEKAFFSLPGIVPRGRGRVGKAFRYFTNHHRFT